MTRIALIISGLVVACALFVGGLVAIGGPGRLASGSVMALGKSEGLRWTLASERERHRRHRETVDGSGPSLTREIPWLDYDILALDIPADVTFIQSTGPASVRVTGSKGAVEQVVLHSGLLHFRDHVKNGGRMSVVVTAPHIKRFELSGANKLFLQNYRQDRLQVDATGGAQVSGQGSSGVIQLYVSGAARVDLSRLMVDGADIEVTSQGHATVSPARWAHLYVGDQGEVTLAREPGSVESDVTDRGRIVHAAVQAGTNLSATPLLQ